MGDLKTLGGFTCPHCFKLNLCVCSTCKPFYEKHGLGGRKYCTWTEDGEGWICSYCNKPFSPDESLDAEFELLNKKIKMNVIYSGQYKPIIGESIFLAGCSPRTGQNLPWRKEALAYYQNIGFEGTVIVPEPESGVPWEDYITVVEWENHYLKASTKIIFWLPRSISEEIYGFTSNVEFGMFLSSGKIIFGRPNKSDKNNYLDYWYRKLYQYEPFDNLQDLIGSSVNHTFLFKPLEVEVVRRYGETDTKFNGDSVVDFIVDGVKIYVDQDWYHNKVDDKIEGYLDCLKQLGIKYQKTTKKVADCAMLND